MAAPDRDTRGCVYLVGAGPGDPGLLTLRGKECLERADVICYDYLANPALLDFAPRTAERIYVGRRGRGAYGDQDEINDLLITKAREGKTVIRLKGGDPFVFGRGGEEAEAIAHAGIPFEIVPGVTAAVAVPAYAGIPVTHRTFASTVTFVTGHEDATKGESHLEWPRLATADGTLVFLMGVKNLPAIVEHLRTEGRAAETPAAVIRWGTRALQRTVVGTLHDIVEKAKGLEPPAVIVVGNVVGLRAQLNWFESKPLFGKRVLVTRAPEQAGELSRRLAEAGAEPIECPTITIVEPDDPKPLDGALDRLDAFDWLIFTSVNGVRPFMTRLAKRGRDSRALSALRLACIGPRTADELGRYGLRADLVPNTFQAEGLIEALLAQGVRNTRILIARAAIARDILPQTLSAAGADVTVVPVYRTIRAEVEADRVTDLLRRHELDLLTFASSSTVKNFCDLFAGPEELRKLTAGIPVACIGPITAETAREMGLTVAILPRANTIPSLVEAIIAHFRPSPAVAQ
ncbi:MAG TPA: uroporphyrinogen-III C-methyltransferase [Nitrospirales bacterium]|nr:uroporphyrinogen-III C-methyltransferase [Nitrospirales bacterium]